MVRITEALIRKRAEHNELMIGTLEELSLHQLDIERIEHLDRWCRDLKILYLQYNLIPRIEHVGRLKELEYLNLALNNIERIEGLEGCEKLKKLDLTANFIGEISSLERLRANETLRELYLTGNPCTNFTGYRPFVVAALQQLGSLDGQTTTPSERLQALQQYENSTFRAEIERQEREYARQRENQRRDFTTARGKAESVHAPNRETCTITEITSDDDDDQDRKKSKIQPKNNLDEFGESQAEESEASIWNGTEPFTPEGRLSTYKTLERVRAEKERKEKKQDAWDQPEQKRTSYFSKIGEPVNVNEAKLEFRLEDFDDARNCFELRVPVYRYMHSSLVQADVQPTYVRVTIKGKVLQLVLSENVRTTESTAKRSLITGELIVTMPKLRERSMRTANKAADITSKQANTAGSKVQSVDSTLLELESKPGTCDGGQMIQKSEHRHPLAEHVMVSDSDKARQNYSKRTSRSLKSRPALISEVDGHVGLDIHNVAYNGSNEDDFVDDESVPPLEMA